MLIAQRTACLYLQQPMLSKPGTAPGNCCTANLHNNLIALVKEYKTDNDKVDSIMFGTGLERTKKAFEMCMNANDFLS